MTTEDLPRSADVVVIGGGVIGASTAYHLAATGIGRVVLLERDRLGCGTSWHSAANIAIVDASERAYIDFYNYALETFAFLEEDTGQVTGWRKTGRVQVATNQERVASLRHIVAVAEANGVPAEIIDANEANRRLPILRTDDVLCALWTPSTGRVNVTDLIVAYARAARKRGAIVVEQAPVVNIELEKNSIAAVATPAGRIATPRIVNCAGLWAPKVAEMVGVRLPIHANEHFYFLTKPFEGIRGDMPSFRDADAAIYGREEVGGLLLGCFEKRAKPIAVDSLPAEFSFSLLREDWDQFEPYMHAALHRIPGLQHAEVKMLLNGPESFTPDNRFLLGPVEGVEGFYVLAGMNSAGVNFSPGAGRGLAELITGRPPFCDITPFSPQRFARFQSNADWLRERIAEAPGHLYSVGRVAPDYETGRRLRRSPLHALLEARGMRFSSALGWERPDLGMGDNENEAEALSREWQWIREAVALYDSTAAGRFLTDWVRLCESLDRAGAALPDVEPRQCSVVYIPTAYGGGRARALVKRLDEELVLVTVDAECEAADAALFGISRQGGIDPAALAPSGLAQIVVAGPKTADLLDRLLPEIVGLAAGALASIDLAGAEGVAARLPDSDHWLLTLHAEYAAAAFEHLAAAAAKLGGGPIGRRTMECDRVLRAMPVVGHEILPTIPVEVLEPVTPAAKDQPRLVAAWADLPLLGGEPLWSDGSPVGFVTSAANLPDGRHALIGFLSRAVGELQVASEGRRAAVTPRKAETCA